MLQILYSCAALRRPNVTYKSKLNLHYVRGGASKCRTSDVAHLRGFAIQLRRNVVVTVRFERPENQSQDLLQRYQCL